MTTTPSIQLEMQGPLALMTMTQPARGNPFDGDFTRDFKTIAEALWQQHEGGALRGVLLRTDGANYSYGGDLKSFYPVRDRLPALVREWTANLHMGLQRFAQLPVPVVTAVQGFAMGGGVALMAGCDVVLAGQGSRFGSAFAQLGFSCDSGSRATLTMRMGAARARRFVMLAEVLGSEQALQAGLETGWWPTINCRPRPWPWLRTWPMGPRWPMARSSACSCGPARRSTPPSWRMRR